MAHYKIGKQEMNTELLLIGIFAVANGVALALLAWRQIEIDKHLSQVNKILVQIIEVEVELLADKARSFGVPEEGKK
jgi:hypothetical protein